MRAFTFPHRLRRRSVTVLAVGLLVTVAAVLGGHVVTRTPEPPAHAVISPAATPLPEGQPSTGSSAQPKASVDAAVAAQVDRIRHLPPVSTPTEAEPIMTGEATTQPDLYAGEFVRRLLTQDFRTPRDSHLAWVQSESVVTTEPLVVGLVPTDLRDRLAVFSVTDNGDGSALVPPAGSWQVLATHAAYDTSTVGQVIEPLAWRNAVAAGRVTDPGVTCRVVAATVTRHERVGGRETTTKSSVSVTLNLEGPPTRTAWAFVAVLDVTVLPMGMRTS